MAPTSSGRAVELNKFRIVASNLISGRCLTRCLLFCRRPDPRGIARLSFAPPGSYSGVAKRFVASNGKKRRTPRAALGGSRLCTRTSPAPVRIGADTICLAGALPLKPRALDTAPPLTQSVFRKMDTQFCLRPEFQCSEVQTSLTSLADIGGGRISRNEAGCFPIIDPHPRVAGRLRGPVRSRCTAHGPTAGCAHCPRADNSDPYDRADEHAHPRRSVADTTRGRPACEPREAAGRSRRGCLVPARRPPPPGARGVSDSGDGRAAGLHVRAVPERVAHGPQRRAAQRFSYLNPSS
jgi:hypothetical protein